MSASEDYPYVSDFLYMLRDEAGKAADVLRPKVEEAQATLNRLDKLANGAEQAAELVAGSMLEPEASAKIPYESGLVFRESDD